MKTTIEMEFEFAYNAWKANNSFNDDTAKSLMECLDRTAGSEIDKAASTYPIKFLNYVDKRIREIYHLQYKD